MFVTAVLVGGRRERERRRETKGEREKRGKGEGGNERRPPPPSAKQNTKDGIKGELQNPTPLPSPSEHDREEVPLSKLQH